jgi:hypothetical protein
MLPEQKALSGLALPVNAAVVTNDLADDCITWVAPHQALPDGRLPVPVRRGAAG